MPRTESEMATCTGRCEKRRHKGIRDYIKIREKVPKASQKSHTNEACLVRDEALVQPTLDQFISNRKKGKRSRVAAVPVARPGSQGMSASLISRGVRKKASTCLEEKENRNSLPFITKQTYTDVNIKGGGGGKSEDEATFFQSTCDLPLCSISSTSDTRPNVSASTPPIDMSREPLLERTLDLNHQHSNHLHSSQESSPLEEIGKTSSRPSSPLQAPLERTSGRPASPFRCLQNIELLDHVNTQELLAELSYCEKIRI